MGIEAIRRGSGSTVLKLVAAGALILLLLIPLGFIRSLVEERRERSTAATGEISSSWGASQTIGGGMLIVPFTVRSVDTAGTEHLTIQRAYFLPESLRLAARLAPDRRHRGIFETVVYRLELHADGSFRRPDFSKWGISAADVHWDSALLSVGITDLRGIPGVVPLKWKQAELAFAPGAGGALLWASGLSAALPDLGGDPAETVYPFSFDVGLNGSGDVRFLPLGRETEVTARSPWPDPGFQGAFLPESRTVGEKGFDARWRVSYFGRSYPQQWMLGERESLAPDAVVTASSFGVGLLLPADGYQKTERSVKYGILFLLLTFLTFWLYELFAPVSVHPIQFLLVGSALCVFYLLLLSISEQATFAIAYAIAASATISLIAGYSAAVLDGGRRAALLGGVLTFLYGYLYVLLEAEDWALLLGSVGLFLILAFVMFVTRRIDWSRDAARVAA